MRTITPIICLLILLGLSHQAPVASGQKPDEPHEHTCGPMGDTHVRTTLYFGLTRPAGAVTQQQWREFLRAEITPRFPAGLTEWEASGQWRGHNGRITRERAKVVLLMHDDTPEVQAALTTIVTRYKEQFQQESVLWETSHVCAAF